MHDFVLLINIVRHKLLIHMAIRKLLLITILTYLLTGFGHNLLCAQITVSYSIGGIGGGTLGSSLKTSTYSNSLMISGTKCYTVTNSLSKFTVPSTGKFFTSCDVNPKYININIKVFPNPAVEYTIIKFLNKLEFDNKFKITLYSNQGQLISFADVTQDELLSGYKYNLSSLSDGVYVIQISSSQMIQSYKIIKS